MPLKVNSRKQNWLNGFPLAGIAASIRNLKLGTAHRGPSRKNPHYGRPQLADCNLLQTFLRNLNWKENLLGKECKNQAVLPKRLSQT